MSHAFHSFVLCPESLRIEPVESWKAYHMHNSRFERKAELQESSYLQIGGTIDTGVLDKDGTYSVLYFFSYNEPVVLDDPVVVSLVEKDGTIICSREVHINPGSPDLIEQEGEIWPALDVGKFQPSFVSREIAFNLQGESGTWMSGLVFAGVEIRALEPEEATGT